MIKRIVGVLFTIAVFGVIIMAAINFGGYRSLAFNFEAKPKQVSERIEEPKQVTADSTKKKSSTKKKKKLTPEQIEKRKAARAAKAAKAKAAAEKKSSESQE
jgi:hypothetical protein